VVAGDQQAAAAIAEAAARDAFLGVDAVADIDRKQPQLIEVAGVEARQHRIGGPGRRRRVAR
jgi:hypothetical protein